MNNTFLSRLIGLILFGISITSCDKDVSDVGANVLGSSDISSKEFRGTTLQTKNLSLETIQGNDLPYYKIGTQLDEIAGKTSYSEKLIIISL